uniref:Secreted protein n=1 Tax=Lotus japonicus TaxID=34305 RepID=I3SKC3_LOTJA|nr:unknown [Lotus japonicus]
MPPLLHCSSFFCTLLTLFLSLSPKGSSYTIKGKALEEEDLTTPSRSLRFIFIQALVRRPLRLRWLRFSLTISLEWKN